MKTITSEDLLKAAQKSNQWLRSRQTEKGNYVGFEEPDKDGNYPDTDDLGCYYKSIYFLRIIGDPIAASRGMHYVTDRFMSPEGDFYNSKESRSSGSYAPVFCHLYPNMWLMRAASAMRWYGLAKRILNFMLTCRDPKTGGFYSTVGSSNPVVDLNSTGLGALCCMLGGKIEPAIQSAKCVLRLIKEQPESDKFFLRWNTQSGFETDLGEIPDKQKKFYRVAAKEPEQAYWCVAWPMNSLLGLYEYTGDERYFKGALQIYDFLASCHPNAFGFVTAGKGGWGSSMLYRMTGDERYLKTALSQMEFILSSQHEDGYMLGPGAKSLEDQPLRTTFDYTADFSTWLVDTALELGGKI